MKRRDERVFVRPHGYAGAMAVRTDCRHYSSRSTPAGTVERCKLDMAQAVPFDCPDNCIFFEERAMTTRGWEQRGQPDRGPGGT